MSGIRSFSNPAGKPGAVSSGPSCAFLIFLAVFFAALTGPGFSQESETEGAGFDGYLDFGADEEGLTLTGAPETTQQMTVIQKEAIEKRNPRDLSTLLEDELDMSVTRWGGYGNQTELSLRGFDTERIAILINGIPANSPRSGDFDVSQVDINNVERVEVIYGGSDTKYNVSGALGGVINIITVKKQKPGFNFNAALANTGYLPGKHNERFSGGAIGEPRFEDIVDMQSLSFSAGYGAGKFSWKAGMFGNRAGNHYLYEDDYGKARRKQSNEVLDTGGNVSLVWDLPADATLLSDSKYYYARRNFPITMTSIGHALATDLSLTESLQFNAPVAFREDLSAEASLTYQYSNTNYGALTKNFDHYVTGITRWGWYPGEKLVIRAGADWRFLYIDSQSSTETDPVKTGNQGGVYVAGEFSPAKTFMLIGSVKGATDTKQAVAVPKLGWRWEITPRFTLKNNYFRSFKFPDFDDLYYRSLDSFHVGNPNLRPEDGLGADLTGEFAPSERWSVNATVYGQYTYDSIHWMPRAGASSWTPENVGEAWFIGADLRPKLRLRIDRSGFTELVLGASYQYQLSWLMTGNLTFADAYRIPYMPNHIAGGTADLSWGKEGSAGSLLLSVHYESTRYANTMNTMVLDPYVTAHATVNQGLGKYLAAFAAFRNILNAHYESFAGYYMPGVSLALGLRARY
ncbi:MAG: TonB-dependent receptor [Treponema sp.]|jgi:outer membrane cobalamin receptor|nr:TonB-dependent receptor [Treponema sp.]